MAGRRADILSVRATPGRARRAAMLRPCSVPPAGAAGGGGGGAPGVHDAEHGVVQHEACHRLQGHQEIHPRAVRVGRQLATVPCSSDTGSRQVPAAWH